MGHLPIGIRTAHTHQDRFVPLSLIIPAPQEIAADTPPGVIEFDLETAIVGLVVLDGGGALVHLAAERPGFADAEMGSTVSLWVVDPGDHQLGAAIVCHQIGGGEGGPAGFISQPAGDRVTRRPGTHIGLPVQILAGGIAPVPVVVPLEIAHPGGDELGLAAAVHVGQRQAQAGILGAKRARDLLSVAPPGHVAIGVQVPADAIPALVDAGRVVKPAKDYVGPAVTVNVVDIQPGSLGGRIPPHRNGFPAAPTAGCAIGSQVPADTVVGLVLAIWVVNPGDH